MSLSLSKEQYPSSLEAEILFFLAICSCVSERAVKAGGFPMPSEPFLASQKGGGGRLAPPTGGLLTAGCSGLIHFLPLFVPGTWRGLRKSPGLLTHLLNGPLHSLIVCR